MYKKIRLLPLGKCYRHEFTNKYFIPVLKSDFRNLR